MKLFFKYSIFLLILANVSLAKNAIYITHNNQQKMADTLKMILTKRFNFPANLILENDQLNECSDNTNSVIHFCIDEKSEVKIIEFDWYVVRNNFETFIKLKEE